MKLHYEVIPFSRYQRENHYPLYASAWKEYISAGTACDIAPEVWANLYENNPAGSAFLALATEGGKWVGSLSAIPFRAILNDRVPINAYQISDAMVAPTHQHRGIFTQLCDKLTQHLAGLERAIIFTFPSQKTQTGFLRYGYQPRRTLATQIFFPSLFWSLYRIRSPEGRFGRRSYSGLSCREITLNDAGRLIDRSVPSVPGLVRDQPYLAWRYFQPEGKNRYFFHLVKDDKGEYLVITTEHLYGKRKFFVLLEVIKLSAGRLPSSLIGLLLKLGWEKRCSLLYSNGEHFRTSPVSPAWGISLPRMVNPRPVYLAIYPREKNREEEGQFVCIEFANADWLGFL